MKQPDRSIQGTRNNAAKVLHFVILQLTTSPAPVLLRYNACDRILMSPNFRSHFDRKAVASAGGQCIPERACVLEAARKRDFAPSAGHEAPVRLVVVVKGARMAVEMDAWSGVGVWGQAGHGRVCLC